MPTTTQLNSTDRAIHIDSSAQQEISNLNQKLKKFEGKFGAFRKVTQKSSFKKLINEYTSLINKVDSNPVPVKERSVKNIREHLSSLSSQLKNQESIKETPNKTENLSIHEQPQQLKQMSFNEIGDFLGKLFPIEQQVDEKRGEMIDGNRYNVNIRCPRETAITIKDQDGNWKYMHANRIAIQPLKGEQAPNIITTQHPLPTEEVKQSENILGAVRTSSTSMTAFYNSINASDAHMVVNLTNTSDSNKGDRSIFKRGGGAAFDYWPKEGERKQYENIEVETTKISKENGYDIITLKTKDTDLPQKPPVITKIYHFTAWPDHGLPNKNQDTEKKFNHFLMACRKESLKKEKNQASWVHCHAGVGRTGSFVILQQIHDEIDAGLITNKEALDDRLHELLFSLRKTGGLSMVQTEEQWAFVKQSANNHFDDYSHGGTAHQDEVERMSLADVKRSQPSRASRAPTNEPVYENLKKYSSPKIPKKPIPVPDKGVFNTLYQPTQKQQEIINSKQEAKTPTPLPEKVMAPPKPHALRTSQPVNTGIKPDVTSALTEEQQQIINALNLTDSLSTNDQATWEEQLMQIPEKLNSLFSSYPQGNAINNAVMNYLKKHFILGTSTFSGESSKRINQLVRSAHQEYGRRKAYLETNNPNGKTLIALKADYTARNLHAIASGIQVAIKEINAQEIEAHPQAPKPSTSPKPTPKLRRSLQQQANAIDRQPEKVKATDTSSADNAQISSEIELGVEGYFKGTIKAGEVVDWLKAQDLLQLRLLDLHFDQLTLNRPTYKKKQLKDMIKNAINASNKQPPAIDGLQPWGNRGKAGN